MNAAERKRFDSLLEQVLAQLPPRLRELLAEAPLIVEDRPSAQLQAELGMDPDDVLCGLHSGTPLTERSVELENEPETIRLFREGILEHAGGWQRVEDEDGHLVGGEEDLRREIRITLLHEIGHHFGLDEEGLAKLGYE